MWTGGGPLQCLEAECEDLLAIQPCLDTPTLTKIAFKPPFFCRKIRAVNNIYIFLNFDVGLS